MMSLSSIVRSFDSTGTSGSTPPSVPSTGTPDAQGQGSTGTSGAPATGVPTCTAPMAQALSHVCFVPRKVGVSLSHDACYTRNAHKAVRCEVLPDGAVVLSRPYLSGDALSDDFLQHLDAESQAGRIVTGEGAARRVVATFPNALSALAGVVGVLGSKGVRLVGADDETGKGATSKVRGAKHALGALGDCMGIVAKGFAGSDALRACVLECRALGATRAEVESVGAGKLAAALKVAGKGGGGSIAPAQRVAALGELEVIIGAVFTDAPKVDAPAPDASKGDDAPKVDAPVPDASKGDSTPDAPKLIRAQRRALAAVK